MPKMMSVLCGDDVEVEGAVEGERVRVRRQREWFVSNLYLLCYYYSNGCCTILFF
jgi:hypothetical protein